MKVAVATWNNRVAPVYDTARTLELFMRDENQITHIGTITFQSDACRQTIEMLKERVVSQIVCGAISRECEDMLVNSGIEVNAFIAGSLDDVIHAIRNNTLSGVRFAMPGCGCPRRRCGRRQRRGRKSKMIDN